jgi:5'-methylthioadenosine phosphorylase
LSTAIIGGTGLEQLGPEFITSALIVDTLFGPVPVTTAKHGEQNLVFLSRHGVDHSIAPHQIDYQANIAALTELGVTHVFATNAVGSLRTDLPPGSLVLLDDFIDFTHHRKSSYWDGHPHSPGSVVHTDFSIPYCPSLRASVLTAASDLGVEVLDGGTYVCAEGPRFESPAEVRLFAQWGGDVVGMTGLPEAIYAREAGLCYAALAIVTNLGAGLSNKAVNHEEVVQQMAGSISTVQQLLLRSAKAVLLERNCGCGTSLA